MKFLKKIQNIPKMLVPWFGSILIMWKNTIIGMPRILEKLYFAARPWSMDIEYLIMRSIILLIREFWYFFWGFVWDVFLEHSLDKNGEKGGWTMNHVELLGLLLPGWTNERENPDKRAERNFLVFVFICFFFLFYLFYNFFLWRIFEHYFWINKN